MNALVFADDRVLFALRHFIDAPSHQTFAAAAVAMRHDLWGRGSKIAVEFLRDFPFARPVVAAESEPTV